MSFMILTKNFITKTTGNFMKIFWRIISQTMIKYMDRIFTKKLFFNAV